MKRSAGLCATALCLCLSAAATSLAQVTPFDMSPEGAGREEPAVPSVPRPAAPSTTSSQPPRSTPPAPAQPEPAPAEPVPVGASGVAPGASEATAEPLEHRRYLMPMERLSLGGEIASRQWAIFLSDAEVGAARTIRMSYLNAILVAPEASRLRLRINGQTVIDTPVQASDTPAELVVDVPPDVLESGLNTVQFSVDLRHRTDCTIQSTYELWTEIESAATFIEFDENVVSEPSSPDDLLAIGYDETGRTRFDITVPVGTLSQIAQPALTLSQGLAVLAGMPNPEVTFFEGALPSDRAGDLSVVLGPVDEIDDIVPTLSPEAFRTPFAGFQDLPDGRRVFVISGPDWTAVNAAVQETVTPARRPVSVMRTHLIEPGWRSPDAPLLFEGASIPLRELGVPDQDFSGRLFRTTFAIATPADFYAESYGEARILLDAAFTSVVRPGSRIDVYVNGNIATTLPIGSTDGAVLREYPVPVTLQHFRPGANEITLEAVLDTEADEICLPGTSTNADRRFALFSSSQFVMPAFARISRRPNLEALSGVGYPYNRLEDEVPLVLAETSGPTLSATATVVARMALIAGRLIDFTISTPNAASGRDALFIGPASRMPSGILAQVGVSDTIRMSWGVEGTRPVGDAPAGTSIDEWEQNVGGFWRHPMNELTDWLEERFEISADALRLTRQVEAPYEPTTTMPLLVAQGRDPSNQHTWTVVTAPTSAELATEVGRLAQEDNWNQMGGRLTTFDTAQALYVTVPANDIRLVPSVPASFANLRLVAANWLSANALVYAIILALASIALGVATGIMAGMQGRRE